jgi:hypothetical protein
MGDLSQLPGERLDSWKAIAAYLRRDVGTARRWEKVLRLPVRRVPGGPGTSVFAYNVGDRRVAQERAPARRVSSERSHGMAPLALGGGTAARDRRSPVVGSWLTGR